MAKDQRALTDKEKQTLRLLLAGHDAKSMARHLGLSVHTVNERLRDARRKLGASSSREAARLLGEAETPTPDSVGDKVLGDAAVARTEQVPATQTVTAPLWRRPVWLIGGLAMLSFAIALVALSATSPAVDVPPVASTTPRVETEETRAARQWLALVDASDWPGSWRATGEPFRKLNTVEVWTTVSQKVRVPLGAVTSREMIGAEWVPAPPAGYQMVKFRTRYANKPEAVETLSLVLEGGTWRVVGYFIE